MKSSVLETAPARSRTPRLARALREWSGQPFDPSLARRELLHQLFEAQTDARPDHVAIECGDVRLTYRELDRSANRLAHHLRKFRVGRGSCVALLLERSADVFVALLAVMKAGAAYVPLDPDCPPERVKYILGDCKVRAVLTTTALATRCGKTPARVIRLDRDRKTIARCSAARLVSAKGGARPNDLCYVIYTSGSTGRPKGVQVEHRSVCNFVRGEGRLFGVRPSDRVYQGLSIAFDASVEEVWLAFFAGATLVVATPEIARSGPDLARHLTAARITVVSTVPTPFSMLEEDVPTLRLLIFGGEACPPDLVRRWAKPGRRIINTYGPTEATVTATSAELDPNKPVTLGRPLPNYFAYVLDDSLQPLPPGEPGELHIGGIGLARGYVGRPDLTREKFLANPFAKNGEAPRIYKTGDRVRWTADGELEFLGRVDSQVKLRGYRIELSEIEAVLMEDDKVRAAACAVREDTPGVQQLVGYVVPSNGEIDKDRLRASLQRRLPAYMIPALIETIPDLPRLPSGKLDRASLPAPRERVISKESAVEGARTDTERRIAEVWQTLFHPQPVSTRDDFFLDLGGHSLLAARMVSALRKHPQFARVSVADVYKHPTITALATALDAAARTLESTKGATTKPRDPHEPARHFRAGLVQSGALYFAFGFRAVQWVTPYLVYFMLLANECSVLDSAAWAAASAVAVFPLLLVAALAIKWLLLGRIQPGRHPLWGNYYLRWWFVQNVVAALPLERLCGTPLLPFVYRLFGARIGRDVHLETDHLAAFDLISIGDHASIDDSAWLLGSTVEQGELVLGPVEIGRECFVGTGSVLREHTAMEDGARIEDLSLLPSGTRIPRGETWAGSPAQCAVNPNPVTAPPPARGRFRRAAVAALYGLLAAVLPVLPLCAFIPGVAILTGIDLYAHPFQYLAAAPLVGASFVLLLTAGVVLFKWLLVGRVRAGTYPVDGGFYIRKWVVDQLLAMSLDTVGSLHATLYLPPWYRALGAKLGRFVELSTATSATPDLLDIADGGTIADEVSLGAARIEGGWMTLAPTRVGRRAFVGNGAVLAQGTALGDESLIGVLSISPADPADATRPAASWMGSPPIRLPRRQASTPFPDQRTYCPSRKLRLARGAVELLRITLPPAGFILVTTTVITAVLELWEALGLGPALLLLPLVYAACCVAVALALALAKWIIIGRFRPFERPLISAFVWRLEFVNALYEFLVTPLALEALQGTPMLPWYYRLLGARIGRRTYFHTTGLLEFDLVEVGDGAVVNEDCVLQSHLFEDRVLKAAPLRIGKGCEVGTVSVVLYDSAMEDGARLDALSLLMKGEVLPTGTRWAGSPARCTET
ncbi:MAG TPA: Pls/PosA family non-ribosomal peptide synthetase [Verrucomicrobiae bacterium]